MQSQLWQLTTAFPQEISAHIYSYASPYGVFLPFHVSFDGRYSSRRNAYECTVTFINRINGNVMQRYHVIRRRTNDTRKGQLFVGAAKCAEGYAISEIINSLQQRLIFGQLKCFFLTYCHDHDTSASKLMREQQDAFINAPVLADEMSTNLFNQLTAPLSNDKSVLPIPLDLHDKNHAAVNAGKGASKIWSGFGCQTSRAFLKCCNKKDRTLSERQAMMRNYPYHWAGNHENCIGCDSNKKPIIDLTKQDAQLRFELLVVYFDKLAQTLPHYIHTAHTNGNESVNNMFTLTAPKRKDYKATYKGRIDLQIL